MTAELLGEATGGSLRETALELGKDTKTTEQGTIGLLREALAGGDGTRPARDNHLSQL